MSEKFYKYLRQEYFESFSPDSDYGEFYTELKSSALVSEKDALQVLRLLDKNQLEEADEKVERLLT